MPVIRVSCPTNALTAEQKAQLAPLLSDGVMDQEIDPVTDAIKSLAPECKCDYLMAVK